MRLRFTAGGQGQCKPEAPARPPAWKADACRLALPQPPSHHLSTTTAQKHADVSRTDLAERTLTLKRIGKVYQSVAAEVSAAQGPRRVLSQTFPGAGGHAAAGQQAGPPQPQV